MTTQQAQPKSEVPVAERIRLGELVNYQEGAVVSRTILKRLTGTVTVFAFDQGQGLSEHTSPFDALIQMLEGQAEIIVAGKPLSTGPGESVLLPANQPHAVKAVTPFKMLLTMVRS
jgi:quercetin dioxygenase-like cupin family protein